MTTDHEAKAREVVKKQFGLFGFDLVLAPKHEAAAIKVVASALREAEARERERCAEIAKNWKSSLRPGSEARLFGHQEAACEIAAAIRSTTDE